MYECVCISTSHLILILLQAVTPCFAKVDFVSSGGARDNSLWGVKFFMQASFAF